MKNSNYNILVDFVYDGVKYVLYTDNTYNDKGEFNIYTAGVDEKNNLFEPTDVDMDLVFKVMVEAYKNRILEGDFND